VFEALGLHPPKRLESTAAAAQLHRCAVFDDQPVAQHDDPIEARQRRQPMGDGDYGAVVYQIVQRRLDLSFRLGIQR